VLRAATDVAGADSDDCASQYSEVVGIASSTVAGHDGTDNAGVEALEVGGMIWE
jgi:hypothetical protein